MTQLILPAAGALAGAFYGGGTGAAVGWAIGSAGSQALGLGVQDGPAAIIAGAPQVGDLRVQTSSYGVVIPLVLGKSRLGGNTIWAENKVPHTTTTTTTSTTSGKGGSSQTTTSVAGETTYTVSMAISICHGPIRGIARMWQDGEMIIDARSSTKPLAMTVYPGDDSQLPDPFMESKLGVGNVPAYRGLAYCVFKDFDLGVQGRIPNFSFEVYKEGGF